MYVNMQVRQKLHKYTLHNKLHYTTHLLYAWLSLRWICGTYLLYTTGVQIAIYTCMELHILCGHITPIRLLAMHVALILHCHFEKRIKICILF